MGRYGRLGNQLFQIAATVAHARRCGVPYCFQPWASAPYFGLRDCFYKKLPTRYDFLEKSLLHQFLPIKRSINLIGYFQSEKYFADCKPLIRSLLTPTVPVVQQPGVASIHVRREDYLEKQEDFALLGMDYFEPAMERLGIDRFLVFSTDTAWCRDHFIGNMFTFVEGGTQEEDLAQMSACEHNIIANSSFSWWAAWLNAFPKKRIIAPNRWAGPARAAWYNLDDKLPKEWERVG